MNRSYQILSRNVIVEPSHKLYEPDEKHFNELVEHLRENGLENAISVCPIPNSNMFEILDGFERFKGWCGKLNNEEILCEIKKVNYSAATLIDKRIELNHHRQKTLYDKLREGLEYYYSLPEVQGDRNDLKNETKGSRMYQAHKKCGVSVAYLYHFKKIVEYDKKYPGLDLVKGFQKHQLRLIEQSKKADRNYKELIKDDNQTNDNVKKVNTSGAELFDNDTLVIKTGEAMDKRDEFIEKYKPYQITDKANFASTNNRIISENSYQSERFKIIRKDSTTLTRADIPEDWLGPAPRIFIMASDPFHEMKDYHNENNAGAIGNELTPEQHNQKRLAVYKACHDIMGPGDSCMVEYDGGNKHDRENLIIEDFNIGMVRQNHFHKKDVIAWHRKNNAMQGKEATNLYSSWTPITWFVKDINAFMEKKPFLNIPFHKEGKEMIFGIYGGRQNAEKDDFTNMKPYFSKPYKRFTNFIIENDFLDCIKSAGGGSQSHYIQRTYGVKHPCPYLPVVPFFPILYLTRPNDIIIDPFSGTGSTLVCGLLFNRRVIAVDSSPEYYKILIGEMEKATREFNPESALKIEQLFQDKFAA